MLKLKDFYHLPTLDRAVDAVLADTAGMIIVCGPETRPNLTGRAYDLLLPGGRSTIAGILFHAFMDRYPKRQASVVTRDRLSTHISSRLKSRVRMLIPNPPYTYPGRILDAQKDQSPFLVVDRLDIETAPGTFAAAQAGKQVLTQYNTILRGPFVIDDLANQGVSADSLDLPVWLVVVKRLSALCRECRVPIQFKPETVNPFTWEHLDEETRQMVTTGQFYQLGHCAQCQNTGRAGEFLGFDIFHYEPGHPFRGTTLVSMESYNLQLASQGYLQPQDAFDYDKNLLFATSSYLTITEDALTDANSQMSGKMAELEAAHRVLQKRTEVLISLQTMSRDLISSVDLSDLAGKICKYACELCAADRAILYFNGGDEGGTAMVLASIGWDPARITRSEEASHVFGGSAESQPKPFLQLPTGIAPIKSIPGRPEPPKERIKVGIRVPLIAQTRIVGVMIIQSTQKDEFPPREVAILQTFGNQAALAIQRASLINELRKKINQLELAQVELIKKERLDRELELARNVQQSVIPKKFPQIPGFEFSAQYRPARQVGGDFYDVIRLDDDHFGVLMADVSDKGMAAALYMALTRSLILAEGHRSFSPSVVLQNVNRLLKESGDANMFVSVFYGVVHTPTRQMVFSRAGHEYPVLLRSTPVELIGGKGTVLGILDGEEFTLPEETIDLDPGDRLVLFTDGMIDVQNSEDLFLERFDFKRMLQSRAHLDASHFSQSIFEQLSLYQGEAEQFDDMAILVMDVTQAAGQTDKQWLL